jgi:hypothetical protein
MLNDNITNTRMVGNHDQSETINEGKYDSLGSLSEELSMLRGIDYHLVIKSKSYCPKISLYILKKEDKDGKRISWHRRFFKISS